VIKHVWGDLDAYQKDLNTTQLNELAYAYIYLGRAYGARGDPELQISNYKEAARLGHQTIQDWLKKNGHDW
tara:strand:- start:65 stop:277 length:213 start_codon:yes stop_codon:yes gene_type:complete